MSSITKQILHNEADTLAFAAHLATLINDKIIIFLYGPLGAGKTTFTRGFLRGLQFQGKVKSPTYTLVEPYQINDKTIFHFDFYRINDPMELQYVGIEEYFHQRAICLIEWPEKALPLLPDPDLNCYIAYQNGGREIRLQANSQLGNTILQKL